MAADNSAGRVICQLSNFIKRIDKTRRRSDLAQTQEAVLCFLVLNSGQRDLCQKDIADEFELRPATVTAIVDELEKRGLVYRKISAYDSRVKFVLPTEKGMQGKPQLQQGIAEFEAMLTAGISEEDLEIFFRVAAQMADNLKT